MNSTRKVIRYFIINYSFLNYIYWFFFSTYLKKVQKAKFNKSCIKRSKIIGERNFISSINNRKNKRNKSTTCHIIGSGISLNKTIKLIHSSDFIMGCNFAGLLDIDFDLYTFEFASHKRRESSALVLKLATEKLANKTDLIFFKNIWEKANSVKYVNSKLVDKNIYFLKDIYLRCLDESLEEKYLNIIVNYSHDDYIYQHISSIIMLISAAKKANFKKIVLHGVDFGGRYFYEDPSAELDKTLLKEFKSELDEYININLDKNRQYKVHMKNNFPKNLEILKSILNNVGVELYSNAHTSGSSRVLPVFNFYNSFHKN